MEVRALSVFKDFNVLLFRVECVFSKVDAYYFLFSFRFSKLQKYSSLFFRRRSFSCQDLFTGLNGFHIEIFHTSPVLLRMTWEGSDGHCYYVENLANIFFL